MMKYVGKLSFAMLLGLAVQSQAVPILGGYVIVETTGNVTATFLGHTAAFSNDLYLYLPANDMGIIFNNHTTPVGTTADLGTYAAGTELQFMIYVNNTGHSWFSGDASRNVDGLAHAVVDDDYAGGTATYVGFEDLFGGGDNDYDDIMFSFTNTAGSETPPVPEPSTMALMGLGAVGLGFAARRRFKA